MVTMARVKMHQSVIFSPLYTRDTDQECHKYNFGKNKMPESSKQENVKKSKLSQICQFSVTL